MIRLVEGDQEYEWSVRLARDGYEFHVHEDVYEVHSSRPPIQLLSSDRGTGWWWSGERQRVLLKQIPPGCALSAAAADATFPARRIAEFVGAWGFFDPSPSSLRRGWPGLESSRLDVYGRNLAERLYALKESSPEIFNQLKARERVQILLTTHSPLLLDFLNEPSAVCVVQRNDEQGTRVVREANPEGVRQALEASGFGLGEFYETKGFGG